MLAELEMRLSDTIDMHHDSIIVYTISNPKWIKKKTLGIEKSEVTQIL